MIVSIFMQSVAVLRRADEAGTWQRAGGFDRYSFAPLPDADTLLPDPIIGEPEYRFVRRYGSELYLRADVAGAQLVQLPRRTLLLDVPGRGVLAAEQVADLVRVDAPGFVRLPLGAAVQAPAVAPAAIPAAGRRVQHARPQQSFGW